MQLLITLFPLRNQNVTLVSQTVAWPSRTKTHSSVAGAKPLLSRCYEGMQSYFGFSLGIDVFTKTGSFYAFGCHRCQGLTSSKFSCCLASSHSTHAFFLYCKLSRNSWLVQLIQGAQKMPTTYLNNSNLSLNRLALCKIMAGFLSRWCNSCNVMSVAVLYS